MLAPACTAPGGPDEVKVGFPRPDAAPIPVPDGGITAITADLQCFVPVSSQTYPPRASVTSGEISSAPPTYFTSDLFARFKTICGGCHVDNSLGNFTVSAGDFSQKVTRAVVDTITSDDPNVYMPPSTAGFPAFKSRPDSDPVRELVDYLNQWLEHGSPAGSFALKTTDQESAPTFAITPTMGANMTNLGTCVPGKRMVGIAASPMDDKDAVFAKATELPATLDKTDLVTLDSEELAKQGVISFAPTYPLWTENAGKMRYVRVPRGQSITFDKATQQFHIPPNTRFYKTFLKEVIDIDGQPAWRKMETRLIVSRPDVNGPDGRALEQTALYGTYIWSDDESTPRCSPIRCATASRSPIASSRTSPTSRRRRPSPTRSRGTCSGRCRTQGSFATTRSRALVVAWIATWGASARASCSASRPLQLARRPDGRRGAVRAGGGRRADAAPTADRLRRDQRHDLAPTTSCRSSCPREPAPPAPRGADRAGLHARQLLPLPQPPRLSVGEGTAARRQAQFLPQSRRRHFPVPARPHEPGPVSRAGAGHARSPTSRRRCTTSRLTTRRRSPSVPKEETGTATLKCATGAPVWILAPWRSLVYRNVETPFDYFEDFLPFPHMPMHSPGYDCRAPKIIGDWMVSIPAELIHAGQAGLRVQGGQREHGQSALSRDHA